jgi:hypothetical protein
MTKVKFTSKRDTLSVRDLSVAKRALRSAAKICRPERHGSKLVGNRLAVTQNYHKASHMHNQTW